MGTAKNSRNLLRKLRSAGWRVEAKVGEDRHLLDSEIKRAACGPRGSAVGEPVFTKRPTFDPLRPFDVLWRRRARLHRLSDARRHGAGGGLVLDASCGAPEDGASRVGPQPQGTINVAADHCRGRLWPMVQFAKSAGCGMTASGVRRAKGGAFQWVQTPPGDRSSRKQSEQSWR